MGYYTAHKEGAFSYADLATTDGPAALNFYTELFNWSINEQNLSSGGTYVLFEKKGKVVAAAYEQSPEQQTQGEAPAWSGYFTASDVDLRTKEAESLGGTVIAQPFDVEDAGRMSVIADPAGAVFCLWQPAENIGAELMNEPNTLGWAECASTDVEKAKDFYRRVMAWAHEDMDMGEQGMYTAFQVDGESVCGLYAQPVDGMPSSWLVYFEVSDCSATTSKAGELGGTVVVEPTQVPRVGTFSHIVDPQGAAFGIIQSEPGT